MQIFSGGKQRFYSFMEFYITLKKFKGQKFDPTTTLSVFRMMDRCYPPLLHSIVCLVREQ